MLEKLPLKGYVYSALALDLFITLAVVLSKGILPPVVPLLYGKPIGGGQLVSSFGLIIAPLAAIAVTLLNILLALRVRDEFLKRIFSIASFFVSALAAIAVVKIILLVGFW